MPTIFVVEGLTDATFFQELLIRVYLHAVIPVFNDLPGRRNMPAGVRGLKPDGSELEVQFRYLRTNGGDPAGGKTQIPAIIKGMLDEDIPNFAVAEDIDGGSPEQVIQSIHQVVYSHLGMTAPVERLQDRRIVVAGRVIDVIPIGLYKDGSLAALGITSHALEDYLVKLMLEDPGLRRNAPELQTLLHQVLRTIRDHQGPFVSSKEVFQLIKPIVQHSYSDTGVVQRIIQDSDEGILRSVLSPLLVDIAGAFSL